MLMLASTTSLLPATGRPTITPTQDMVLGHLLPDYRKARFSDDPTVCRGAGMRFRFSLADAQFVHFDAGVVDLHAKIKVRDVDGQMIRNHPRQSHLQRSSA